MIRLKFPSYVQRFERLRYQHVVELSHERLTRADRALEEDLRQFESKPLKVGHFIYARSKRRR